MDAFLTGLVVGVVLTVLAEFGVVVALLGSGLQSKRW